VGTRAALNSPTLFTQRELAHRHGVSGHVGGHWSLSHINRVKLVLMVSGVAGSPTPGPTLRRGRKGKSRERSERITQIQGEPEPSISLTTSQGQGSLLEEAMVDVEPCGNSVSQL